MTSPLYPFNATLTSNFAIPVVIVILGVVTVGFNVYGPGDLAWTMTLLGSTGALSNVLQHLRTFALLIHLSANKNGSMHEIKWNMRESGAKKTLGKEVVR
ncbi:uncharacterized protein BEWA_000210 [Theileria equi strain WA]|uniref:Membrane protein, putative n=1 Tax=Theileria equi strain WA TaxID=1537102 RepID=L0AYE8_THEEQ|nr:uncharacterized protein BEWA_000210 [Theileria equi strain WA]AFZ80617.1 membrane protein, putative [Theileria equi strain WA]|eukprot:XP_004830283.1 uncharacterized protein BEWA_000210 [Theileria equi strain WA]